MRKTSRLLPRYIIIICFIIYMVLLIKLIIFKYPLGMMKAIILNWNISAIGTHIKSANLIPFLTIRNYLNAYRLGSLSTIIIFENLVGNIVVFIPFGFLLPLINNKCKRFKITLVKGVLLVLSIELFQLITILGEFDIDDIILNVFGVIIGYLIYKCGSFIFYKIINLYRSIPKK